MWREILWRPRARREYLVWVVGGIHWQSRVVLCVHLAVNEQRQICIIHGCTHVVPGCGTHNLWREGQGRRKLEVRWRGERADRRS